MPALIGIISIITAPTAAAIAGIDTNPISAVAVQTTSYTTEVSATYDLEFHLDENLEPADFTNIGVDTAPSITFFGTFKNDDEAGSNIDFSDAVITLNEALDAYIYLVTQTEDTITLRLMPGTTIPANSGGAAYALSLTNVTTSTINSGFQKHQIGATISGFSSDSDYCGNEYDRENNEYMCTMSDAFVLSNDDFAKKYGKLVVKKIKKRSATINWEDSNYWLRAKKIKIKLYTKGGSLIKTFNIKKSKIYNGQKTKKIGKKYLKSGRKYKVRAKTLYSTGASTNWSKYKKFTTKN